MASVTGNAFLIMRVLYENGAYGVDHISFEELDRLMSLSEKDFDVADSYLLERGMINGTMGGRYLTSAGIEYVERELPNRVVSTLACERLLRFLVQDEKESDGSCGERTACEALGFTRGEYREAAQELVDNGLVESLYGLEPPLHLTILRSTPAGRKALRRGFVREPVVSPPAVAIASFIGTMEGGSVQALGTAIESSVLQVANDPALLTDQFDHAAQKLLDAVREELSGIDLEQYTGALNELREELLSSEPDEGRVKRGLRMMAFLGDLEGSVALTARVWGYLAPFLPLVVAKFAS